MKYKYSVNNKNQLLIKPAGHKVSKAASGRFSVNKNNRLAYWLNEPAAWRRLHNLPSRIDFAGNWKLDPNYDLELNLNETKNQYKGGRLVLKGEIISCDRDTLSFELMSRDIRGNSHIQLFKLSGSWQADEFNRIIFAVKKKGSPDVITLEGAWHINNNQQVTYTYEKTALKRRAKLSRTLNFEGFWQISKGNRLTYILSNSSQSRFDFRVQLESPNLYPAEGLIKYRIGVGLRKNKQPQTEVICLYGSWKFGRKGGLNFRVDYGRGRFRDIEFGANAYFTRRDEVAFSLSNGKREPLGINIIFTHRFLKHSGAEAYLRVKDILDRRESGVQAGVRTPF